MRARIGVWLSLFGLAAAVGCGKDELTSSGNSTEPAEAGASMASAGAAESSVLPGSSEATGGMASAEDDPLGVLLTPMDGWVDGMSNALMIQGAMFDIADPRSRMGMKADFSGAHACIQGATAVVDRKCTPTPPATDCFGTTWGAGVALNLNQAIDEKTGLAALPQPFDASALKGFAFDLVGAHVPHALFFQVETDSGEAFCASPITKLVTSGPNFVTFDDTILHCTKSGGVTAQESGATSHLMTISWIVPAGDVAFPFDFCVANVRAIP